MIRLRNEGLLVRMIPRDVPEFDTGLPELGRAGAREDGAEAAGLGFFSPADPPMSHAEGPAPLPLFGLGDEDGTGEIPALVP